MKQFRITTLLFAALTVLNIAAFTHTVRAEDKGTQDLAKASQNPVANMISLPLQNNTNFGVGPGDDVQNILNIQPVVPVKLSENWNLITRTIAPVIYQPELVPGYGSEFGLGDINTTLFLSPAKPGKLIWGVGPVLLLPHGNRRGSGNRQMERRTLGSGTDDTRALGHRWAGQQSVVLCG